MIDLHTHLLPDWDDGAKDWEETVKMIRAAENDSITKIGLTPHLFRKTKHGDDIKLFEQRIAEFRHRAKRFPIKFFCGAEVYIDDQILEKIKKNNLTINDSSYVFVELPADSIIAGLSDLFYRIMLEGYIPIISHPERNIIFTRKPALLFDLVSAGAIVQITAKSILGDFGREAKHATKTFLKHNLVHIIASDAHNSEDWLPTLSSAVERTKKIVGEEKAMAMVTEIPQAILDNKAIPGYGDPVNPETKRTWRISIRKS